MLVIRLTRKGKKNQPFFKVVVVDKRRSAKGGRAVEVLGFVDPLTKKKSLKKDRILHWIKSGAQPSNTVHNLLVSEKIIDAKKMAKHKKSKQETGDKGQETSTKEATKEASSTEATKEISDKQQATSVTEAVTEKPVLVAEKPAETQKEEKPLETKEEKPPEMPKEEPK